MCAKNETLIVTRLKQNILLCRFTTHIIIVIALLVCIMSFMYASSNIITFV